MQTQKKRNFIFILIKKKAQKSFYNGLAFSIIKVEKKGKKQKQKRVHITFKVHLYKRSFIYYYEDLYIIIVYVLNAITLNRKKCEKSKRFVYIHQVYFYIYLQPTYVQKLRKFKTYIFPFFF